MINRYTGAKFIMVTGLKFSINMKWCGQSII